MTTTTPMTTGSWLVVVVVLTAAAVTGAAAAATSAETEKLKWTKAYNDLPPSFLETREMLFRVCDTDSDGVLVEEKGRREVSRMFGLLWEFRDTYRTAGSFLSHRDQHHKQLNFHDFVDASIATLNTVKEKFEEVIEKTNEESALFFLGVAHNSLHDFASARKWFNRFLDQNPSAILQVKDLAESLEQDARTQEASTMLEAVFDAGYVDIMGKQSSVQHWRQICNEWRSEHGESLSELCRTPDMKPVTSEWLAELKSRPPECHRVSASSLDEEGFKALLQRGEPTILEGAQEDWAPAEDWVPHSLNTTLHAYPVDVHLTKDGSFYTTVELNGTTWAVRPASEMMTFGDYLTLAAMDGTGATAYLEYTDVWSTLPPLQDFISRPAFTNFLPLRHINFWAGPGATISCVHSDSHENILFQVVGEKEFVLFPPSDHKYLYYDEKPGLYLSYEHPGRFEYRNAADDRRSNIGGVHLHEANLNEHPLIANTSPRRCRVRQGEALYVPYSWHHQVESFPSSDCEHFPLLNIAVNYWWAPASDPNKQVEQ